MRKFTKLASIAAICGLIVSSAGVAGAHSGPSSHQTSNHALSWDDNTFLDSLYYNCDIDIEFVVSLYDLVEGSRQKIGGPATHSINIEFGWLYDGASIGPIDLGEGYRVTGDITVFQREGLEGDVTASLGLKLEKYQAGSGWKIIGSHGGTYVFPGTKNPKYWTTELLGISSNGSESAFIGMHVKNDARPKNEGPCDNGDCGELPPQPMPPSE